MTALRLDKRHFHALDASRLVAAVAVLFGRLLVVLRSFAVHQFDLEIGVAQPNAHRGIVQNGLQPGNGFFLILKKFLLLFPEFDALQGI